MSNDKNNIQPIHTSEEQQFQEVLDIIQLHRQAAAKAVNEEALLIYWHVGAYVSAKLQSEEWGVGSSHTAERISPHPRPGTQRLWSQKHLQHGALLRLIFIACLPRTAEAYWSGRNPTAHIRRPKPAPANCAEPFCTITSGHKSNCAEPFCTNAQDTHSYHYIQPSGDTHPL